MYTMMTSVYNELGVIHQSEHRLQPARIVRLSKQDKLTVTQIFEKTNNSCRNNSKSPCHFCLHIALYMYIRVLETVFKSRGFYLWTKLLPVGEISNHKTAILQTESAELTPPPSQCPVFPHSHVLGGGAKFSGQNSVGSDYGHSQTGFVDGDGEYCCSGQNSGGTEFGHSQTGVRGGGGGGVRDRTAMYWIWPLTDRCWGWG